MIASKFILVIFAESLQIIAFETAIYKLRQKWSYPDLVDTHLW